MAPSSILSISTLIARPLLGAVLLWAGIAKLRHRDAFEQLVAEYQLLSASLARRIGRLLPLLEIMLGAALVIGFSSRWAAFCTLLLLTGFSIAVGVNLVRGRHLPCLCFGKPRVSIGWWTIYRNGGLLVLSLMVYAAPEMPVSLDNILALHSRRPLPIEQVIPVIAFSMAMIVVWLLIGAGVGCWKHLIG